MKIDPASVPFAATLAAGVLVPSWLPRRRLATFAATTAASSYTLTTSESPMFAVTVTDTKSLTKSQEKQLNVALTALSMGLLSVPLVGVARTLPIPRLVASVGVAAGFLVLDDKRAAWMARRKPAAAEKADLAAAPDPPGTADPQGHKPLSRR